MYRIAGYKAKEEVPIKSGAVDLVVTDGKEIIAIEIETGKSDAIHNIKKDLQESFDKIISVVLDKKAKERVGSSLSEEEKERVEVIEKSDLE